MSAAEAHPTHTGSTDEEAREQGGGPSGTGGRVSPPRPTLRLVPPPAPLKPLRLRSVPALEPAPCRPGSVARAQEAGLPIQQELPLGGGARRLWSVTAPACDGVPTPAEELPAPEDLAHRLVQATVDVVRGLRPASQVLRWTTPEVYSQLRQRARLECADPRTAGRRPVVRSVRTSRCGPTGVEVSAVVLDGGRARAVAARLDGMDGRWRMTALQIG